MFVIFLDHVSISCMLSYIPVHLSFPYYPLVVGFDSPCMLNSKMYSRSSSLFHYWVDPLPPSLHHTMHTSTEVPCCIPEISIMS